MKRVLARRVVLCLFILVAAPAAAQEGLKVFISVDMEGITGVINRDETTKSGSDYQYFRKLLRDWSGGPFTMMEGIDKSFDAVIFVGYHAKAGTKDATLDHTMSSVAIHDLSENGISLPEAGWNGLIAGYYNVPVAFIAGDKAICEQAKAIFPGIETVAVKEGIGEACLNLHPMVGKERIREGVKKALSRLDDLKPLTYKPPLTIEVQFKNEHYAYRGSWYPGAKRVGDYGLAYTSDDFFDLMRFLMLVR